MSAWPGTSSCHQWSRPACMGTSAPVRRSTTMLSIDGASLAASSAVVLSATPAALPPRLVLGDERLGAGRLEPLAERLGREAAEDDDVGRADPGARQHRDGQLGHHAHVDPDDVALADPEPAQGVGHPADVGQELGIRDRPLLLADRFGDEVVGDLRASARGDVPVEAVVADVQDAVCEPRAVRRVPVEPRGRLAVPVEQRTGLVEPERVEVSLGTLVDAGIGNDCLGDEFPRWRELAPLLEQDVDGDLGRLPTHIAHLRARSRTRPRRRRAPS